MPGADIPASNNAHVGVVKGRVRLFIAEKPSLARAIADVLPTPHRTERNAIFCGSSDVVAWCVGHILEQAPPDAYNPAWQNWTLETLPMVPQVWQLDVKAKDLLATIKRLLKSAARVVHAGDPDREGQLLVNEVLDFLNYRGPVDRVLIPDLNPAAVARAVSALRPNSEFAGLGDSALARQRADWLYGMNMTRLYTLLGQKAGYKGVLSVGRVQTPVLGLIVRRDREIECFAPRPFFEITGAFLATRGRFEATWQGRADADGSFDSEGRLVDESLAASVLVEMKAQSARVAAVKTEAATAAPPLPYSLPDLQIDASMKLGLSAAEVLEAAQGLYEIHRAATYPRSDCRYLPAGHHADAPRVLDTIRVVLPDLAKEIGLADVSLRSAAWNDKKVTAHHAIIPTPTRPTAPLPPRERALYELIAKRYLAQFFRPEEYVKTAITVAVGRHELVCRGRRTTTPGWTALFPPKPSDKPAEEISLPSVAEGEVLRSEGYEIKRKMTAPPKLFDDASIVRAMVGIARYVADPEIRKILRDTDGIGTPATQAQIIETLFERGYVVRKGRAIVSTEIGRGLVDALPEIATIPDMTALWEAAMRRIEAGEMSLDAFLGRVTAQLRELIRQGAALGSLRLPAGARASERGKTPRRSRSRTTGHERSPSRKSTRRTER